MFTKDIDTSARIHDLLAKRWSGVAFDPDRPVERDTIRSLAEAARWAPSCFGDQPWRYIICSKSEHPEGWEKAFACLAEGNQRWARHAPVLLLTCCHTRFTRNERDNYWCEYDSGAASMCLCLQAASLDLMTHQMGGFSADKARELFAIPEAFKPMAMMAVGYQLPRDRIPEEFQEKEFSPRRRDPLSEHFFLGEWDAGME